MICIIILKNIGISYTKVLNHIAIFTLIGIYLDKQMKGFINNDIKRLIVSLSIRNKNNKIVKSIKTHVQESEDNDIHNLPLLHFYNGKWTYQCTFLVTLGMRLKTIYIAPSYYFSKSRRNPTQISTINGHIYIFENNVLKSIEQYGYNMKTWNDMYNYLKKR